MKLTRIFLSYVLLYLLAGHLAANQIKEPLTLQIIDVVVQNEKAIVEFRIVNSSSETVYLHRNVLHEKSVANQISAILQNRETRKYYSTLSGRTDGDEAISAEECDFFPVSPGNFIGGKYKVDIVGGLPKGLYDILLIFRSKWSTNQETDGWQIKPWRGSLQSKVVRFTVP